MEFSESESYYSSIGKGQIEQITNIYPLNIYKTNLRYNEAIIIPSKPFSKFDSDTSKRLSKEICRIVVETKEGKIFGTGFFLAFQIDLKWFHYLVTNDHVISKESINDNNIIYIYYEEFKTANIKLDRNKRYIKSFIDKNLDITVIQILDEDNISKKYFLQPELNIPIINQLINNEIYIPQYIDGKEIKKAEGIIKDIIKYEFSHLANTIKGSSGSPIILKNSNKVIGIHKGGSLYEENFGVFIYPVIKLIKEEIRQKINNNNNNNNNNNINENNIFDYESLINDKYEENKKISYDNGDYYIGQYKNGLRNGKGTLYLSDENIRYEGDWINDKYEGNGKYIYESGEYYIGQFKNDLKHGKGTLYFSNGEIKQKGNWINDVFIEN